ncbi:MAG: GTPase Era [Methanonatronarchaeales archaeon]|nr:GTPase Era [Methanonatronarchaeales archaeon]
MGLLSWLKKPTLSSWMDSFFGKQKASIGIYGPPNAGKTTLANRIVKDLAGEEMGPASPIPHETRRAMKRADLTVQSNGASLHLDIVDTPGIATKIDFEEFVTDFEMKDEEAKDRAKEATEGVIEAINWINDCDAVLLVMDSTKDPFNQANVTIIGNMEARKLPLLIVANKTDQDGASPQRIMDAFPQHPVVQTSALEGEGIEELYESMIHHFG